MKEIRVQRSGSASPRTPNSALHSPDVKESRHASAAVSGLVLMSSPPCRIMTGIESAARSVGGIGSLRNHEITILRKKEGWPVPSVKMIEVGEILGATE